VERCQRQPGVRRVDVGGGSRFRRSLDDFVLRRRRAVLLRADAGDVKRHVCRRSTIRVPLQRVRHAGLRDGRIPGDADEEVAGRHQTETGTNSVKLHLRDERTNRRVWFPALRFRSFVTASPCSVSKVRKNYVHP